MTVVGQGRAPDEILLGFARALHHLGTTEIDLATASATLGALVKYREDSDRVKQALERMLAR